ncbi:MAG: acetate uptake transporter [Methanosarcinales archaeon]|jgi:succinate-acetate transporter protein|nr:acetate uptake transporter [Methanosarcinales archaeon]
MSGSEQVVKITDSTATSDALGLAALAVTTLTLAFWFFGQVSDIILVAMALFAGGFTLYVAGVMAFKKGSTFSTVTFGAFGVFWIGFAFIFIAPFGLEPAAKGMEIYYAIWGLLSAALMLGVIKLKARLLIAVFVALTVILFALAVPLFVPVPAVVFGILALILGLLSFYGAMAITLNEVGYKFPL